MLEDVHKKGSKVLPILSEYKYSQEIRAEPCSLLNLNSYRAGQIHTHSHRKPSQAFSAI